MHCSTQDIKVGSLELSASQASEGFLQAGQIFGLLRSCLSWNHRSSPKTLHEHNQTLDNPKTLCRQCSSRQRHGLCPESLLCFLPPLCELVHAEAAAFVNILPNATLPSTARNRAV